MSIYDKLVGATPDGLLPPAVLDGIDAHVAEHTPTASRTTVTYWVTINGDDADDGSQARPFRTIAKAVSMVPDLVRADHVYTITLGVGEWDEGVYLDHRVVYGQVIIEGSTEDRDLHKVDVVRCDSVLGYLTVRNLTTTRKRATGASFRFYRCTPMVLVENVRSESDSDVEKGVEGVIGLLADQGSNVLARDSDFGGKRYGIRSNYLSRVFSRNNTGSGNTFGLGARWGGIMSTSGTQPTGDTDLTNSSGGILAFEHGGKIGLPDEAGLVSTMGHGDSSPVIKRYHLHSGNTGINGNITNGQIIRARIRAPNDGPAFFRVAYGGQTNSNSAQGIERTFYGVIRRGSFSPASETTVFNHAFGDYTLELVHAGSNGVLDLRVGPLAALSGRWAIDVEMAFHRNVAAPVLESVTLV